MIVIRITLGLLSLIVVVQTALSFVRSRAWWVRIFDFPRPQIAASSVVLLGLSLAAGHGRGLAGTVEHVLVALLACAALAQVWQILPYTRLWKHQVLPAPSDGGAAGRLRIVISNVRMRNRDSKRWLDTVRAEDPDLIIAVEVDAWWDRALGALSHHYPHQVRQPQDNTYGLALYSKHPLGRTRIKHLVESDVPSVFTAIRLPCGREVHCVVLHPRPPRPDIRQDSSLRDAELVRAGNIVRTFRAPVIVAGDLNDVAWSHTTHLFQRIAHLLDPRLGRGLFATFPADHRLVRFPLDHVFHSNHFNLVELRRLAHVGSDHFPMMIELALRADDTRRVEAPEMDASDEEQANDAVEDARELRQEETAAERRERKLADK